MTALAAVGVASTPFVAKATAGGPVHAGGIDAAARTAGAGQDWLGQIQLELAARSSFGLARTGSGGDSTSGDFVIAFSTVNRVTHRPPTATYTLSAVAETAPRIGAAAPAINRLFAAVIEATEEAVLTSIFKAGTMIGRDWHVRHGLPIEETLAILRRYGRGTSDA